MSVTKPGIYPDLADKYHSEQHTPTECLTQSKIKVLLEKTPFDLKFGVRKASKEMDIGSVAHALALGKGARFAISPYDKYTTNEARDWRDGQIEAGIIPLKEKDHDAAQRIAKAIRAKVSTVVDLDECETECPFFWKEGETWCSGSLDIWHEKSGIIIDPKITSGVHQPTKQIINMGWDIQAAWYKRGVEKIFPEKAGRVKFYNLLISPDAPHTSRLVQISDGWIHARNMDCDRALTIWKDCLANNRWPSYDDLEILNMPEWALREHLMKEMEESNG